MSTNWGLHCTQCDEDSPTWFNRGRAQIEEVVQHWGHIQPLLKTDWIEVHLLLRDSGDEPSIFKFMETHGTHPMVLLNEWGERAPLGSSD
jgi:hypothetical protein